MRTGYDALTTLWAKASDHLDVNELKHLANLDDHASFMAGNLAAIVEGIGCLVMADDRPGSKAGNFTNADDVSKLLFSIANQVDYINGLLFVSAEARTATEYFSKKGAIP